MSHMLWLGEKVVAGERDLTPKLILEKIEAVGPEDIIRVSKEIFRDNNISLAVIGPTKDEKLVKETLHFK